MKKLLCLLVCFVIIFSLTSCKAARGMRIDDISDYSSNSILENSEDSIQSNISPLLWKVTSEESDNTIWLFGSIHVADESAYPLPNEVMNAYESSDALAVECDISKININYKKLYKSMMYSDGSTIKEHISSELYEKAKKIISDKYGEQMLKVMNHYVPIIWSNIIEEIYMSKGNLEPKYGIDTYFLDMADDDDKVVLEVESADFQLNMLLGFSEELQEILLADALECSADEYNRQLENVYENWKKGDLTCIKEMLFSEIEGYSDEQLKLIEEYNNAMLFDRNKGMAEKVKEYLADGKNVFFVVGEAHMIGEGGIVQLLTDEGYNVERVDTNSESYL